jgi:gluconate 2-dehydrogenase gamma chain
MHNDRSSRRAFLAQAGGLASGGWLALNTPLLLAAGQAAEEQRAAGKDWANMTPQEALGFAAVVDQIIPPDDLPGASEAGVVYFIDQALGGFAAGMAGLLKEGLADLDARARSALPDDGGFADLAFEQQTAILKKIDTTPFFNQMIFLTHCGMFAMPSRGGNRNRAGWALLGFDDRHAWQPPYGFYDAQAMAEEGGRAQQS